jgi:hypothetical protein
MKSLFLNEPIVTTGYQPSTKRLPEFSWEVVNSLRQDLERTLESQGQRARVSPETATWASEVILQVLPRHILAGAEVDTYEDEIHVSWNTENGGVTVFFTPNKVLKIYDELLQNGDVVHHQLCSACSPMDVTHAVQRLHAVTR